MYAGNAHFLSAPDIAMKRASSARPPSDDDEDTGKRNRLHAQNYRLSLEYREMKQFLDETPLQNPLSFPPGAGMTREMLEREKEAFEYNIRFPDSHTYRKHVSDVRMFKSAKSALRELMRELEITYAPTERMPMTPLLLSDIRGPLIQHMQLIDRPCKRTGMGARAYLLSADVIESFWEQPDTRLSRNVNQWFLFLVMSFTSAALKKSRPAFSTFSMLLWNTIEELEPLITFIYYMLMKPLKSLRGSTEEWKQDMLKTHEVGTKALQLLLSYMDHIWQLADRSPVYEQLPHRSLTQVKEEMKALQDQWSDVIRARNEAIEARK